MTFLLLVPLALAWSAWRRQQWGRAGFWLGLCASVKLFLLLFVPWLLLHRRWRALAAFGGAMVAAFALGAVVYGSEPYGQWLSTLGRVGWWWLPMNASWQGLVSRAFEGGATVAPLLRVPSIVPALAVSGSAVIAVCALIRSGARSDTAATDRDFLVVLLGAILASPLGWVYYLPLAYGPMLGWAGAANGWGGFRTLSRPATLLAAVGVALLYVPHETTLAGQPSGLASLTVASAYFWGTLAVWLTICLTPRD